MPFKIKRIYEDYDPNDGWRVLIDRLWPRGISKKEARLDEWDKELAPSNELREWFGHIPEKFDDFARRYHEELQANQDIREVITALREKSKAGRVTLLYGAKDTEHNQAVVLRDYLDKQA